MKIVILSALVLPFLLSCGEDHGKGRRPTVKKDTVTPPVTTESGVPSYLHRDRGQRVLTTHEAISYLLDENNQTSARRSIPIIATDDEGSFSNVRTLPEAKNGRPTEVCGVGVNKTLGERISDCAQKNGSKAIWEASLYGAAGESDWKLVHRNINRYEVWIDLRTNMVWADASDGARWCKAAGNTEDRCKDDLDSAADRICKTVAGIDNVIWRLPTRNDFLQADLDGMRFVLPNNTERGFWTATINSASSTRTSAWTYRSEQGTLKSEPFSEVMAVRCIGVANL